MSATAAPLALVGGWTLAQTRQPPSYDALRDTISALAAEGATDPWIMTAGLAVLGACHLATAAGLPEIGTAARAVLGFGGAATIAVAALPQPNAGHVPAATGAFVALAVWPALSRLAPRRAGRLAAAGLIALLGWLAVDLRIETTLGLSERALAAAEALCPLAFAALVIRRRHRTATS